MKRTLICLALFLCATSLYGQTVTNPSFESFNTLANNGTWNYGPIPGWKLTGTGGSWQPGTQYFDSMPAGPTIAWLNVGTITQDLGVAASLNTTYTLTVSVGHRKDNLAGTYSIALTDAGGSFCTTSFTSSIIPIGTFLPVSITCPIGASQPMGNLGITISGASGQVDVDNILLTSKPNLPPVMTPIQLNVQVFLCAKCDGTDDVPFNGQAVIAQANGPSLTVPIQNGAVSVSSNWDFGQPDPLAWTFELDDSTGKVMGTVSQSIYKILIGSTVTGLVRIDSTKFTLRGIQESF